MDFRGEPTTTTLPNQYNPWRHAKYVSLQTQLSVVLTPRQENFSFQQMGTITEKHSQSKCQAQFQ